MRYRFLNNIIGDFAILTTGFCASIGVISDNGIDKDEWLTIREPIAINDEDIIRTDENTDNHALSDHTLSDHTLSSHVIEAVITNQNEGLEDKIGGNMLDSLLFSQLIAKLSEKPNAVTYQSIKFLETLFPEQFPIDDRLYETLLEAHIRNMIASIPDKYVPKGFTDRYFDDFFENYIKVYGHNRIFPEAIIVTNKSVKRGTDHVHQKYRDRRKRRDGTYTNSVYNYYGRTRVFIPSHYFAFSSEEVKPLKTYRTTSGKHQGERSVIATLEEIKAFEKLKPKERREKYGITEARITPEGLFWIDQINENPKSQYGPATISIMPPESRKLEEDNTAYHGSKESKSRGGFPTFGCIRMPNKDVAELYTTLTSLENKGIGTLVIITP
ncbi:MAG: L,D-transpeptidase [Candidatus Woesearchaeota archaeon]